MREYSEVIWGVKPAPRPQARTDAPAPSGKSAKEVEVSTESKPAMAPSGKSAEPASLGSKPAPEPSAKNAKEVEVSTESKPAPAPSGKKRKGGGGKHRVKARD